MAQLRMTDSQQSALTVSAKDARGRPADVHDEKYESSDVAVVTVEVDASDPMKAVAKAVGFGTALITFTGDADLGEGVKHVVGTLDVVVDGGDAMVVEISAGAPSEQGDVGLPVAA